MLAGDDQQDRAEQRGGENDGECERDREAPPPRPRVLRLVDAIERADAGSHDAGHRPGRVERGEHDQRRRRRMEDLLDGLVDAGEDAGQDARLDLRSDLTLPDVGATERRERVPIPSSKSATSPTTA